MIGIRLSGNQQIADADMDRILGVTEIEGIGLDQIRVTDAALAKLKDLPNLKSLDVGSSSQTPRAPAITDAGLVHVKSMTKLKNLGLNWQPITDVGLANIRDLELRDLADRAVNKRVQCERKEIRV